MNAYTLTDFNRRDENGQLIRAGVVVATCTGKYGKWVVTLLDGTQLPGVFKKHTDCVNAANAALDAKGQQ